MTRVYVVLVKLRQHYEDIVALVSVRAGRSCPERPVTVVGTGTIAVPRIRSSVNISPARTDITADGTEPLVGHMTSVDRTRRDQNRQTPIIGFPRGRTPRPNVEMASLLSSAVVIFLSSRALLISAVTL